MKKLRILAQYLSDARLDQRGFLLFGTLLAASAASAIVLVQGEDPALAPPLTRDLLNTEHLQALSVVNELFFHDEKIRRGDSLASLTARMGLHDAELMDFLRTDPAGLTMARQMVPGKTVSASLRGNGKLERLTFPLKGSDTLLIVERQARHPGRFTAREVTERLETRQVTRAAVIRSSLFGASDAADIPDSIATQMADIFSGEIDFHRDLRKGDHFKVTYEVLYSQGRMARTGKILAAEFVNAGTRYRALWFEAGAQGNSGYFTPEGKSLKKAYLRSPLEFSRVTSGFSMRFHPILQEWKAHNGVDYGAPTGTKVRAVADATVEFAGRQNGYGNLVILKHNGQHSTAYAHLNGFSSGLRKGARIRQGDLIGYVGSTGWATGPHLHYEFRVNNKPVNPLSVKVPTTVQLEWSQLDRFRKATQELVLSLDQSQPAQSFE